eukprot:jgi/Astpho2/446/fgenesh1_pg.00011_%23_37_t
MAPPGRPSLHRLPDRRHSSCLPVQAASARFEEDTHSGDGWEGCMQLGACAASRVTVLHELRAALRKQDLPHGAPKEPVSVSDAADVVHVLEAQNELSWEGVDSLKLKYQLLEEANKEEVWLRYLRKVVQLAREAAVEDSSSDGDSSGGNGGSGSAGREGEVSLEDFEALADIVSDVLATSRWLDDPDSGQKALPPLKEYPVPKAFCEGVSGNSVVVQQDVFYDDSMNVRSATSSELSLAEAWDVANEVVEAIKRRDRHTRGLSCEQLLTCFMPLASAAAGLERPCRALEHSIAPVMTSDSEAKEDGSKPQQDSKKGKVYIHLFEMQPSPSRFIVEGARQDIMDHFKFWKWVLQLLWTDTQCYGDGTVFTLWDQSCLTDGILQRGNPQPGTEEVLEATDREYLDASSDEEGEVCMQRCAAKAESLHQLRRTLGEYARDRRPNTPTTGLMPVSLRSAADVANTLARQPDAALLDIWGMDTMALQYLLMDSINREEVWLKFLRAAVTLAQQEEWDMVLEEGSLEADDTPTGDFKGATNPPGEAAAALRDAVLLCRRALAGEVTDVLGTSRWLDGTVGKPLPDLEEHTTPKGSCKEVTGTFDRPALHHELTSEDIWVIASDLLQAIQSRGTAKAGLSCDQQLHYFIPLASVAAGLEVPRRSLEHSLTPDIRKHKHDDSCGDAHGKDAARPCIDMTLNEMQPAPSELHVEAGMRDVTDAFKFWSWALKQLPGEDPTFNCTSTLYTYWDKKGRLDGLLSSKDPRMYLIRIA